MTSEEWSEILTLVYEQDGRKAPSGTELTNLIKSWRLHVGASVTSAEQALARVREFYADGGKFMKPMDLRPKPVVRRPADQGIGQATGRACPWPDECGCAHTWPCVAGWITVDADGFRPGELERGAQLRRDAAQRGLGAMQALLWAGNILRDEFGPPPAAGALAAPCPNCRAEQSMIINEEGSRDAAMIRLRKRSKR